MSFNIRDHSILLTIAGSRAYGLHSDDSDMDIKGVAIPPREYFLGWMKSFEQLDDPEELGIFLQDLKDQERAVAEWTKLEGSVYDIRKFTRLATEANPNILEVLFCRDEEVRLVTRFGEKLRANRQLFVSAKAKHTFSGYAASQLKRINTHRRWLLKPPKREPTRSDFMLPERTLIPKDQLAAVWVDIRRKVDSWEIDFGTLSEADKINLQDRISDVLSELDVTSEKKWKHAARGLGYDENFIALLDRERRYEATRREWQQYQAWKWDRNPERARLEHDHGYDTKHASHLVRLLKMCRELLETGEFKVWRGDNDADEIRSIQQGAWSYEKLVNWAEKENRSLAEIFDKKTFVVAERPDFKAIDGLCEELVSDFHGLVKP